MQTEYPLVYFLYYTVHHLVCTAQPRGRIGMGQVVHVG